MRSAKTRRELAKILYREASGYPLSGLQTRRAGVERESRSVPTRDRRRPHPGMMEAIPGTYSRLKPGTASIPTPATRQSRTTLESNV